MSKRRTSLSLAGLLFAAPALADSAVEVREAWARAPAGTDTVAVYMTLHDDGAPDRLTSVTTDAAGMAMLHESRNVNGVTEMRPVNSVPLPAGGTVMLRPGGLHVMLMDLNRRLVAGDTFNVTLTFEHTAPVTVPVKVLPPGSAGPKAS